MRDESEETDLLIVDSAGTERASVHESGVNVVRKLVTAGNRVAISPSERLLFSVAVAVGVVVMGAFVYWLNAVSQLI